MLVILLPRTVQIELNNTSSSSPSSLSSSSSYHQLGTRAMPRPSLLLLSLLLVNLTQGDASCCKQLLSNESFHVVRHPIVPPLKNIPKGPLLACDSIFSPGCLCCRAMNYRQTSNNQFRIFWSPTAGAPIPAFALILVPGFGWVAHTVWVGGWHTVLPTLSSHCGPHCAR